jgi:nitrate/nitrite transporter NarK
LEEIGMQNSRQAYANLALATAAFAVAFAARSLISPLSHQIQADFNLDNTSIGLLIALPTLLGALMRADGTTIAGIGSGLRWPDRCA